MKPRAPEDVAKRLANRRPRGACNFRQRDVAAALRAARDAGVEIARVDIGKDGQITLWPGTPAKQAPNGSGQVGDHPWDED
jgi:hypothetical protein